MRIATWLCAGLISLTLLSQAGYSAETVPAGEYLFPDTTRGFIAITNVDNLIEHYNKTQLGKLTSDPVMEPFTKDVRRQFENRWSGVHERLGLTLDDLKEVPGGEVAVALIEPVENTSALAIVVDVTGHHPQANLLLERVTTNLTKQGAKGSTIKIAECPEPVIQFEMPIPTDEQEADRSKLPGGRSETAKEKAKPKMAYYFLTGNLLGSCDNLDIVRGILSRFSGKKGGSLSEVEGFKKIVERCQSDEGKIAPQIRWFVYPLGYAAAARASKSPQERRRGKSILELMRNQGVGAIKGVGGYASFSSEGFDLIHRTAVYAPLPYQNAMKMIVLLNGKDYTPQSWVPREISTYTTLYFDIQNAFDNFGPLFDELFGEGESGAWADVLDGLKRDPNGPQLDLRNELIKHLGQRVSMVTDYELPITTASERLFFAIEVTDDAAVAKALQKWLQNDPTAKRREINGHVVWEIVENEGPEIEGPEVSLGGDIPDLAPQPKHKKPNQQSLMPHAAATVIDGNLFVASHLDFLKKVLDSKDKLVKDLDYQLVSETINQMQPQDKCLRVFSRTDEEYRPTYELIRQNKMPESESMFGQLLNQLFGEGKKGVVRHQKIDGSKLPEYDAVRRYLGPAGFQVSAEKDGWFLKGFTLNKEELKSEQTVKSSQSDTPKKPAEAVKQSEPEKKTLPVEAKTPTDSPTSSEPSAPIGPKTQSEPTAKAELQAKQVDAASIK